MWGFLVGESVKNITPCGYHHTILLLPLRRFRFILSFPNYYEKLLFSFSFYIVNMMVTKWKWIPSTKKTKKVEMVIIMLLLLINCDYYFSFCFAAIGAKLNHSNFLINCW